jgi:ABC-type nickel/cobalt efflux system permease component RcnA
VALAVLSMLSHGGTAFALIAFIPFVYQLRRRETGSSSGSWPG